MSEEEDVKEESSPQAESEDFVIDGALEEVVEPTETKEEVKDEVQEEVPEDKPDHRVPYSRLQKVIAQKKESEDTIADLRRQLETTNPPKVKEPELRRPTQEEHGYDEAKYNAALDKYDSDRERIQEAKFESYYNERTQQATQKTQLDTHNKAFGDIHDSDPALSAAVKEIMDNEGGQVVYTDTTRDAIATATNSAELEAYLTINRHEILPKLEGMSPVQQAMELGRISASLVTPEAPKVQDKPISQAPDPIETSDGGSTFIDEDTQMRAKDKTYKIY